MDNVSDLLTVVMGPETALMAVMRLLDVVSYNSYVFGKQCIEMTDRENFNILF